MVLCTKSLIFFSLSSLFKFLKYSTSSVGFWVSFTLLTLLSIWHMCEPHSQRPPLTTTHPTAATTMTTSRTPMKTHMVFNRFVLASSSCQTGTFTCNHCWIVVMTLPMDPKNRPHLLVSYRTTKDYLVSYPRRHCLHLLVHCYLGRMCHHLFCSTFLSLYTS